MNQILNTAIEKEKPKEKPKEKSDSKTSNINYGFTPQYKKKILVFFSIALIIIALSIGSVAGYKFLKGRNSNKNLLNKPEIVAIQEGTQIKVTTSYENGINTVTYVWNDADIKEIKYDGAEKTEELLNVPDGDKNKLYIKAVGTDNNYLEKTINVEAEVKMQTDTEAPNIEWFQAADNADGGQKLKVEITDNIDIDYVEYNWEDEEVQKIEAEEGQNHLEFYIEVERSTLKLYMTAYDKAGNTKEKTETVIGVLEPKISTTRIDNVLTIIVEHDMGIKKVNMIIGEQSFAYDENCSIYDPNKTKLTFQFNVEEGTRTYVEIKAESFEETTSIKRAYCEY